MNLAVAEVECAAVAQSNKIAGVVLAGGRSSRMGESKAFLDYKGKRLVDHMIEILKEAEVQDVYVSGDLEGYSCIQDSEPHSGPAQAICDVMAGLKEYDGTLFVPVDMPFLTPEVLRILLDQPRGAYFEGRPLPAFIGQPASCQSVASVRKLLHSLEIKALALPGKFEPCMANINTPGEWQEALRA